MQKKPKSKKCKACGEQFAYFSSLQKVCSVACSLKYVKKENDKAYKKSARKELKEFNRKELRWQHKQTQPAFNRMRVLEELNWFASRGIEPECISCGKKNMDWCCGHFKTVGAHGRLRYDRKNTYLQCNRYCNMALSGNIEGNKNTRGYKQGLLERFGKEAFIIYQYLEQNSNAKKYTWQELEEIRRQCNKTIKQLNEGNNNESNQI